MADRKVAVVGLDSITPVMIERFLEEGRMPSLKRLRDQGWSSEITPTMPPTTPAAWTAIATGAWPSTHGVEGFAAHTPGEPLDKKHPSCSSDWIRSELIWQAAERAGKRTILLKYPMSWPPKGGARVLQGDGAGGWGGLKGVWDLAHSGCWDARAPIGVEAADEQTVGSQSWLPRDQDNLYEEQVQLLTLRDPEPWAGRPAGAAPQWQTRIELRSQRAAETASLALLALRLDGSDLLAVAHDPAAGPHALRRRAWGAWLRVVLPTVDGPRAGHVRLKVLEFDVAARRLRLYQSQIHQEAGFTRPERIAGERLAAVGPFAEWTEGYDLLQGWIDDETQLEIYEQHVAWMSKAVRHLLRNHPWDLFMTQVHFVDMAYPLYWGAVDPDHPPYDAARAPFYWEPLGRVHELAEQFLGAILAELDPDALVVVLGDHGHDLYHTALLANHLLLRKGLLTLRRDRRTGEPRIDWGRTHAFANGYRVYLNVQGRDPQGIVPPHEARAGQEQVIQALYSVRDPRTDQAPVRLALRQEDAESLGLYGGSMGDVIFAMAPGYQTRSSINVAAAAWIGQRRQSDRGAEADAAVPRVHRRARYRAAIHARDPLAAVPQRTGCAARPAPRPGADGRYRADDLPVPAHPAAGPVRGRSAGRCADAGNVDHGSLGGELDGEDRQGWRAKHGARPGSRF
jgi:predicted AlkP superfamily phosphohydrolase/phosphomutase